MIATKIPSVLQHPRGSISIERALKQIRDLLNYVEAPDMEDELNASLDDIETLLSCIDRD